MKIEELGSCKICFFPFCASLIKFKVSNRLFLPCQREVQRTFWAFAGPPESTLHPNWFSYSAHSWYRDIVCLGVRLSVSLSQQNGQSYILEFWHGGQVARPRQSNPKVEHTLVCWSTKYPAFHGFLLWFYTPFRVEIWRNYLWITTPFLNMDKNHCYSIRLALSHSCCCSSQKSDSDFHAGDRKYEAMLVLRSAVGKTHDLRSDLWWTIQLHIFIDRLGIPLGSQPIKLALARHSGVQVPVISRHGVTWSFFGTIANQDWYLRVPTYGQACKLHRAK